MRERLASEAFYDHHVQFCCARSHVARRFVLSEVIPFCGRTVVNELEYGRERAN
jgi:hypothetical protein